MKPLTIFLIIAGIAAAYIFFIQPSKQRAELATLINSGGDMPARKQEVINKINALNFNDLAAVYNFFIYKLDTPKFRQVNERYKIFVG